MDVLFEQNIVQNTGLCAEAIFVATVEYFKTKDQRSGIPFPLAFLILPIALHRNTALTLKSKRGDGILFKAIRENREIPLGLQRRMESMYKRTVAACSLALASRLIDYDERTAQYIPLLKSLPKAIMHDSSEVDDILCASKRIGKILAEHELDEIAELLEVVF